MGLHAPITLAPDAVDTLMPMHVVVGHDGKILRAGRVLAKAMAGRAIVGERFFDVFEFRRQSSRTALAELFRKPGRKCHLRLRDHDRTPLIAVAVPLTGTPGLLVNLSFGIAVIEAVGRFNLAGSDFAATDLTLEMLYLVEAKSAAMAESRKLNDRLHGAKTVAEAEAQSDTLTGLRNRRALDRMLDRLIVREVPFTLMHLDLDFFKQVNDSFGHAAGDTVLTEVARALREATRPDDLVARVGGDEFVLLFKSVTDRDRMAEIAGRLIHRIEEPVPLSNGCARISASIGLVATTAYEAPAADRMIEDADRALYASKARGRACFTFFDRVLETEGSARQTG